MIPTDTVIFTLRHNVNHKMTESINPVGGRLRAARESKGIKAIQLSKQIGIAQAQLSKIENGKGTFTQEYLTQLQKCLKVNINWLLTGEGEMFLGESPSAAPSSLTSKTCPECGQKYGLEELAKEKDERLETQKEQIQLFKKETQRLEKETERLERENEELKKNCSCVERVEKKVG